MRTVPGDVVRLIKRFFPNIEKGEKLTFHSGNGAQFRAIRGLLDRVPEEMLTLTADDFSALQTAAESIRHQLDIWRLRDESFDSTPGFPGDDPVSLIHGLLEKCPDEAPGDQTAGFEFIKDEDLRQSLRIDKAGVDRAISNGEWKGVTVLSGSLIEALLLWVLQQKPASEISSTLSALQKKGAISSKIGTDLEFWNLNELIEVSFELKLIKEATAVQAKSAKDFRNLIHPGREKRLATRCGRGNAHGALAAVELVIADLS